MTIFLLSSPLPRHLRQLFLLKMNMMLTFYNLLLILRMIMTTIFLIFMPIYRFLINVSIYAFLLSDANICINTLVCWKGLNQEHKSHKKTTSTSSMLSPIMTSFNQNSKLINFPRHMYPELICASIFSKIFFRREGKKRVLKINLIFIGRIFRKLMIRWKHSRIKRNRI